MGILSESQTFSNLAGLAETGLSNCPGQIKMASENLQFQITCLMDWLEDVHLLIIPSRSACRMVVFLEQFRTRDGWRIIGFNYCS